MRSSKSLYSEHHLWFCSALEKALQTSCMPWIIITRRCISDFHHIMYCTLPKTPSSPSDIKTQQEVKLSMNNLKFLHFIEALLTVIGGRLYGCTPCKYLIWHLNMPLWYFSPCFSSLNSSYLSQNECFGVAGSSWKVGRLGVWVEVQQSVCTIQPQTDTFNSDGDYVRDRRGPRLLWSELLNTNKV